ncbi:MAG: hypothetical protein JO296_15985 [Pseudonocardiales bacterium]|nr:hypothetical protein [Pseudonocardiales bacterium]
MTHPHHHGHCPHRELAVGWALHALEPTGNSLVTAHLPDCPTCTHTATQTEEVAALLGLSIPHVTPSAQLEHRILRATSTTTKTPLGPPAHWTPPTPHITRRLWHRAKNWLRAPR